LPYSVSYHFFQDFLVPPRKAYDWCTNFNPGDHKLMGEQNATREIEILTDNTLIITDVFQIGDCKVEKKKLVQLYPNKISWVSTHLTGPNKFSQFVYEISASENNTSRLEFTGVLLGYERDELDKKELASLTRKLCKEDAYAWKLLARAMAKNYAGRRTK
jgi:hypothetical protein